MSFAQQLRHRIARAWQGLATPAEQAPAVPAVVEHPAAPPADIAIKLARDALAQIQQAANDLDKPGDPAQPRRVARTLREHGVRLAAALSALEAAPVPAPGTRRGKAPAQSVSNRLAAAVIRSAAVPRAPSADDQPTHTRG